MSIVVSNNSGGNFTPHPEGDYAAVCVDVHDLGMLEVQYAGNVQKKHKIDIYFFCDEWKDGADPAVPLLVRKRFTATLHEKGILRPFLQSWRGKKFSVEEERGFDLESLIGAPAYITVLHNEVGDNTYANIETIIRLPKGMEPPEIPSDYVRIKDRPPREEQQASNGKSTTYQQRMDEAAKAHRKDQRVTDEEPVPSYGDDDRFADDLPY